MAREIKGYLANIFIGFEGQTKFHHFVIHIENNISGREIKPNFAAPKLYVSVLLHATYKRPRMVSGIGKVPIPTTRRHTLTINFRLNFP